MNKYLGSLLWAVKMPLRQCMSDSGSRRARVRHAVDFAVSEVWDEWIFDNEDRLGPTWTTRLLAPEWGVISWVGRLSCRIWGHRPVQAHCGMSKHDYCEVCHTLLPGEVRRANKEDL